MTGKILLLSAICLSALTVKASDVITTSDSISKQVSVTSEHYLQTLKPTYLTNVSEASSSSGWNWKVVHTRSRWTCGLSGTLLQEWRV